MVEVEKLVEVEKIIEVPIPCPEPPPPAQVQPPQPAKPAEARIIPKVGFLLIQEGFDNLSVGIGENITAIKQRFGTPKPHQSGVLMFNAPRVGEFGVLPDGDKVGTIVLVDSRWRTVEGIGIGSTPRRRSQNLWRAVEGQRNSQNGSILVKRDRLRLHKTVEG